MKSEKDMHEMVNYFQHEIEKKVISEVFFFRGERDRERGTEHSFPPDLELARKIEYVYS